MTLFRQRVYQAVKTIPRGRVMTYQQVAELAGSPRAFRAVGSALRRNDDPAVPCHRVIKSSGDIGSYNRGADAKRVLLEKEGYRVSIKP
jgi:methylated-DNA-[protein]-cysteine S-methyltransferase